MRRRVSDGVLFTGEKYPKAAGDTGAEGPFQGQTRPFPRTPFRVRPAAVVSNDPPNLIAVTMPVRCPAYRSPSARAELPAQTCERLQFNNLSQCRTGSLRRVSIAFRTTLPRLNWGPRGRRYAFRGESRSNEVSEACRLRQAERYAACEDDAAVGFNYPPNLKIVACRFY